MGYFEHFRVFQMMPRKKKCNNILTNKITILIRADRKATQISTLYFRGEQKFYRMHNTLNLEVDGLQK